MLSRYAALALLALAASLVAGCWGALDEEFVKAVDANWSVIGPDYARYVHADDELSEESRTIRLRTAAEFGKLVAEAMAEYEDEDRKGEER